MRPLLVRDVMATKVPSLEAGTPLKEVVRAFLRHRVNALPVRREDGRIAGVVSGADFLFRQAELGAPGWLGPYGRRRSKVRARTAAELMTAPAITVGVHSSVIVAARLMVRHGVAQLPVVDGQGQLTGMVGRADLLRVLARPDDQVRDDVFHEVFEQALRGAFVPGTEDVSVTDGVVTLTGTVRRESLCAVAGELADVIPGVVGVVNHLKTAAGAR